MLGIIEKLVLHGGTLANIREKNGKTVSLFKDPKRRTDLREHYLVEYETFPLNGKTFAYNVRAVEPAPQPAAPKPKSTPKLSFVAKPHTKERPAKHVSEGIGRLDPMGRFFHSIVKGYTENRIYINSALDMDYRIVEEEGYIYLWFYSKTRGRYVRYDFDDENEALEAKMPLDGYQTAVCRIFLMAKAWKGKYSSYWRSLCTQFQDWVDHERKKQ